MAEWHKQVPTGRRFEVVSALRWQGKAGKVGIAKIGYSEEFPVALTGLDFGSGLCCYRFNQLREIETKEVVSG